MYIVQVPTYKTDLYLYASLKLYTNYEVKFLGLKTKTFWFCKYTSTYLPSTNNKYEIIIKFVKYRNGICRNVGTQ